MSTMHKRWRAFSLAVSGALGRRQEPLLKALGSVVLCSLVLLGGAEVSCSSSGGSSTTDAGSMSEAGSASKAGAGGTAAGWSSGGNAGAAGDAAEQAGAGQIPDSDAAVTTPVISAIDDIAVVQNTLAMTTAHGSFTVTDDGGLSGLTAAATSAKPATAAATKPSCQSGTCTFDLKVTPLAAESVAVTVVVTNARGGSAMSGFSVVIAPRMVTTGADTGPGSLRATVDLAAAGDVLAFDPAVKKVQLASAVYFGKAMALNGPGATSLTIDGGGGTQALAVGSGGVSISGVTVTHATFGVAVLGGGLSLTNAVLTNNKAVGLSVSASAGMSAAVEATNSTFSANVTNGAVMQVDGAGSSASGSFAGCTFTGNSNGVAAVTNAAGQTARIALVGGNQIHDNINYGIVIEIDGGLGQALLEMPPAGGSGDNLVTKNPIGVFRSGAVASSALKIAPATQVSANTTNFTPAWP
jgi:hypothetical protein